MATKSFNDFASGLNFYNDKATGAAGAPISPVAPTKLGSVWNAFSFRGDAAEADVEGRNAEETQGLMGLGSKGLAAAGKVIGRATGAVSGARERVQEVAYTRERLALFAMFSAGGALLIFLAFLFLPMVVLAPSKFALLFTLGSLCLMFSFSTLKGHKAFIGHMMSREKLTFSSTYILSLLLTLWATLGAKSYILTLVFSGIQMFALAYFTLSYIPGGVRFMNVLSSLGFGMFKRLFTSGGGSGGSSLPI
eukprot:GDKH01024521.1.p1 GENE.GDKH01024521.1~~GDKH01024521.1.p1  ORF type:complete len:250 (-),score=36.40 GDKH01024521.1:239-988(-)